MCPHAFTTLYFLEIGAEQPSAFRHFPATSSGSVSSSFRDSQPCNSDLCPCEKDTKRTPRWPVFNQQIFDSAKNGSLWLRAGERGRTSPPRAGGKTEHNRTHPH